MDLIIRFIFNRMQGLLPSNLSHVCDEFLAILQSLCFSVLMQDDTIFSLKVKSLILRGLEESSLARER